ncbi:putative lipid II flippase FtsW [Granulicoccus sp. GXG6511]|uniref:putative lipid II flippase FtsW n=1 Tax=Granulicoccus sp. GXG6511 TaxID=3381351 RepID=UPI003D7E15CB
MAILSSPGSSSAPDKDKEQSEPTSILRSLSQSTSSRFQQVLSAPLANFYLVLVSSGLLIALGVMMVLSASSVYAYMNFDGDSYFFVKRQAAFAVVGLISAIVLSRLDFVKLRLLAWPAMIGSVVLLILTYTPLGVSVNGNQNWVEFGFAALRIQPSEYAKLAIIVFAAHVLTMNEKRLDRPRYLLSPLLPGVGLIILLVVFQGDMGTAVILIGILAGILWVIGTPLRILLGMGVLGVVSVAALTVTSPNRMRRLMAFLNPGQDTEGANMQATVGVFALATGGWWGVQLGASRQKWGSLPEAHTDFIFAVIGEELGLIGTLGVLVLFLAFGIAGLRIAIRSDTVFGRVVASGITTWFMFQAMVNLGVVLRLLPVMGVPLPLVSYGGNALLANMMAIGVLLACARQEPEARAALAGKRRKRQPRMTTVVGTRRG